MNKCRIPSFYDFIHEKSKSIAQQRLFGIALAVRRGELDRNKVSDDILKIVDSDITDKALKDFAKTKHTSLPYKVEEDKDDNDIATAEKMLNNKDWFYMMSDDNRVYKAGETEHNKIVSILKSLVNSGKEKEAIELWNKYAPAVPYSNIKMKFPI